MEDELYHYGVKGMKWGVRRSPERMARTVRRLERRNKNLTRTMNNYKFESEYNRRESIKLEASQSKYKDKLARAKANKAKYDAKLYKKSRSHFASEDSIARAAADAARAQYKVDKIQRKITFNKYAVASEEFALKAQETKERIEHNERAIRTFNTTIKALDEGTVKQGRIFMQYMLDEQDR